MRRRITDVTRGGTLALLALLYLSGCVMYPAGPDSSMAPFVQLESEQPGGDPEYGKVSSSMGVWFFRGANLAAPYGSGSLSWWLTDEYTLVGMSTGNGLGLQGKWMMADTSDVRVGFVHGLTFNPRLWGFLTGGVFAQRDTRRASTPYGGVRMTLVFSDMQIAAASHEWAAGWTFRTGSLQWGPEARLGIPVGELAVEGLGLTMQMEATF